jgi:hypothetical protein
MRSFFYRSRYKHGIQIRIQISQKWADMYPTRRWSASGRSWSDVHQLALAFGPLLVSMLSGFFFITAGNRVDQLGQGVASLVAVALLALFAWRIQQRNHVVAPSR